MRTRRKSRRIWMGVVVTLAIVMVAAGGVYRMRHVQARAPIAARYARIVHFAADDLAAGDHASRKRRAASSGVRSRCGCASISYPTMYLRTVADRNSGG